MAVRIYVLVDPFSLKVRYVGRTRSSLSVRLGQHVSKARYNREKTHKASWIKSLLKVNTKPYIRLLCNVEGWTESHEIERRLISRYKDRLLNHDDRGEGRVNHVVTQDQKVQTSITLKGRYSRGEISNPASKEVHVYNLSGAYIRSYKHGKEAANELSITYSAIYKCTKGITKQYGGYQFSYEKVEKMPTLNRKPKVILDNSVQ